jgi:hypothetical protein
MAGTSKLTKPLTARVPVDLLDWIATLKDEAPAAVLVRALRALRDGLGEATGDTAALEAAIVRVADLEEALAQSEARASKWQKAAQAAIDPVATKRVPSGRQGWRGVRAGLARVLSHQSGPVYEPTLNVQGQARPMFRNGSDAEKALKGQKQ